MERIDASGAGLALGGGSARGLAHIGVLKGLEAAGMRPVALAGTSFGAIVAAMAALGLSAAEIEGIVRRQSVWRLWAQADVGLRQGALVRGERFTRWLDDTVFQGARIEEAERPLAVAATDLLTGRPVVLRRGRVAEAVRASCALPGLFAPVEIDGRRLVDGGFTEPVPFAALAALGATRPIGVHTGLDLAGSGTLRRLRRFDAGPMGQRLHRLAARQLGATAWSRLLVGTSLALRSYRYEARAPLGAALIMASPGVAWWDFHRAPFAIEAGERAVRHWLRDGRPLAAAARLRGDGREARETADRAGTSSPLPAAAAAGPYDEPA